MRDWQVLEAIVTKRGLQHQYLSNAQIAKAMGTGSWTASRTIQEYKRQMAAGKTRYVIHRKPDTRTRNALWVFGERKLDTKEVGKKFLSDMTRNFVRDIEPTLIQLGVKEPKLVSLASAIEATIDAHIKLLAAGLP